MKFVEAAGTAPASRREVEKHPPGTVPVLMVSADSLELDSAVPAPVFFSSSAPEPQQLERASYRPDSESRKQGFWQVAAFMLPDSSLLWQLFFAGFLRASGDSAGSFSYSCPLSRPISPP